MDHSESSNKTTIESPPPNQPISPNVTTPQKKKFQLRVKALESKLRRIEKKVNRPSATKGQTKGYLHQIGQIPTPEYGKFYQITTSDYKKEKQ